MRGCSVGSLDRKASLADVNKYPMYPAEFLTIKRSSVLSVPSELVFIGRAVFRHWQIV